MYCIVYNNKYTFKNHGTEWVQLTIEDNEIQIKGIPNKIFKLKEQTIEEEEKSENYKLN